MKIDKGTEAEIELANILSFPLLMDFVQLKPSCKEGKKDRELCDLLVEMNLKAVAIELKTQDKDKAKVERNDKNWAKKQLTKGARQINGALRSLEENLIKATHPFRGEMIFQPNSLQPLYGLVIVDYDFEPFEIDKNLPRRSNVKKIPMHYFSYNDFIIICQKLMTLPDLLDYLEHRSKVPAWATPNLNDEKNFYAYYLVNPNKISYDIQKEDYKDYWKKLEGEFLENYNQKVFEDQKVKAFNEILNILSTVEPINTGIEPKYVSTITQLDDPNRLEVTRILNSVNRVYRREFVTKMFEKIENAEKKKSGWSYFALRTEDENTFFLFLASKSKREDRKKELEFLAHCLNTLTKARIIVGIATEGKDVPDGRSFDFIYLEDFLEDYDPEFLKEARKYFKDIEFDVKYDFPKKSRIIL